MTVASPDRANENRATPFQPRSRTGAPLRLVMTAPVQASSEKTLSTLFDFGRLTDYLSSMQRVDTEKGPDGNPSVRHCTVSGMGTLVEDVVWFDEEKGYAYSARPGQGLPMSDHLAVATVLPSDGGSLVRWEVYFNWKGVLKPMMMKLMLPGMMKSLGAGLQRDLGSAGRISVRWS